jgi:hypothetical protein
MQFDRVIAAGPLCGKRNTGDDENHQTVTSALTCTWGFSKFGG